MAPEGSRSLEAMTEPTDVWNRALEYHVSLSAPGDVALRNALTFDGTAQNGGLAHAVEMYEHDEEFPLDRVLEGYAYLGMPETVRLISETRPRVAAGVAGNLTDDELDALEIELIARYPVEGEDLEECFQRTLAAHPEAFAPLEPKRQGFLGRLFGRD